MAEHKIPLGYAPITTGHKRTKPLDRDSRRNFVYTLSDAEGVPVYVGRSSNVVARIKAHFSAATHSYSGDAAFTAGWLRDVRSVSMVGPFTWDEAVAEEGRQIKSKLPRGNRCGVPKYKAASPRDADVLIEAAHPSRPDRVELVIQQANRIRMQAWHDCWKAIAMAQWAEPGVGISRADVLELLLTVQPNADSEDLAS